MIVTDPFLSNVIRAAILAMFAAGVFWILLRNFRTLPPTVHRWTWFGVLLLGLCVFRLPINIPFYELPPIARTKTPEIFVTPPPVVERPVQTVTEIPITGVPPVNPPPKAAWKPPSWSTLLLSGWLIGVSVLLLRHGFLLLRLHFLLRNLEQADAVKSWAELLRQYGISVRKIPIFWTKNTGPALVRSWFGHRLLFPQSLWEELSERQRLGILRHELCHYLYGDVWTAKIARLLTVLQWFNPAAWLALHKFAEATEWRCDDFSYGSDGPKDLIETLLSVNDSTESLGLYLSSFARLNVLRRVGRLLKPSSPKESTIMKKFLVFVAITTLFTIGMVQINLTTKTAKAEPVVAVAGETRTFDGQIVDSKTKKPIEGVTVVVQCRHGNDMYENSENCFAESFHKTDSEGKYRFTITAEQSVHPDLHLKIMTDHPDYLCEGFYFQSYKNAVFSSANEDGGKRFGNSELEPAVKVYGKIVDPDGKPVYPCNVNVFWVQYENRFSDRFYGIADRDGKFESKIEPGKAGVVKIIPRDFAPKTVYFHADQAGDLGTIQVERGMTLSGKTLDADGRPVGNVRISVQEIPEDDSRFMPQCLVWRTTDSDAAGNFKTRPLQPGLYRIIAMPYTMESPYSDVNLNQGLAGMVTREHMARQKAVPFPKRLPLPDVFPEICLNFNSDADPIEYSAVKTHTISFRCLDKSGKSFGKPVTVLIDGNTDGRHWSHRENEIVPDGNGNLSVRVPQGLTDTVLMVHTEWGVPNQYDNHPIRYRLAKDGPMKNDWTIDLGTIDKDISDIEIYPYKAGRVTIYAKDGQGRYFDDYSWSPSIVYKNKELYVDDGKRFDCRFGFGNFGPDMDISSVRNDVGREVPARAYKVWTLADEPFDVNVRLEKDNLDTRTLTLAGGEEKIVTFTLDRASLADAKGSEQPLQLGLFSTETNGMIVWRIRGQILLPDGTPAKNARVFYLYCPS